MSVLITGVADFLGSHLSDKFLSEGHQVVGLDKFLMGPREIPRYLAGLVNLELIE